MSPGYITPCITCVGNMQNQKIPEEPKTQTEWGRQAHLNVCSVWKEPRSKVLTCDLYFLRFVFDLTRRQSWLFGFKRWYERKVRSSSRVRNMWTTFVHCRVCSPETLPPIPRPKCLGDTVVKQDHVCSEVYLLCCTVMGWGVRVWGSVREWCLARDNFPTTTAIYHPSLPMNTFSC